MCRAKVEAQAILFRPVSLTSGIEGGEKEASSRNFAFRRYTCSIDEEPVLA